MQHNKVGGQAALQQARPNLYEAKSFRFYAIKVRTSVIVNTKVSQYKTHDKPPLRYTQFILYSNLHYLQSLTNILLSDKYNSTDIPTVFVSFLSLIIYFNRHGFKFCWATTALSRLLPASIEYELWPLYFKATTQRKKKEDNQNDLRQMNAWHRTITKNLTVCPVEYFSFLSNH